MKLLGLGMLLIAFIILILVTKCHLTWWQTFALFFGAISWTAFIAVAVSLVVTGDLSGLIGA